MFFRAGEKLVLSRRESLNLMKRFILHWFLLRVVGRRILLGYGAIAILSVAVLASLYMASRYGLEAYVSDQLGRIPYEVSVLQRGETQRFQELQQAYRKLPGVKNVEGLGFLRLRNVRPLRLEIANESAPIRWVAFVSASSDRLLPPGLRRTSGGANQSGSAQLIEAAVVGTGDHDSESGSLVRAGTAVRLAIAGEGEMEEDDEQPSPRGRQVSYRTLFEGELASNPPQIERQEFNRWMLREVGALSYLPEDAIVFLVSPDQFQDLASKFHNLFLSSEGMHGGDEPPPYVPEMTHLISLDRQALVSTWDLQGSLVRLEPEIKNIYQAAQDMTPFAWISSDLVRLLTRMNEISRLISLATLLVAIPLLWMGWVLARWLGQLLVLNQRRLIGLALLRGISSQQAGRSVLLALVLGGFLGGLLGLLVGIGIPVLAYTVAGHPLPSQSVLLQASIYFGGFLVVGVVLAVLSGRNVLVFVRRMTPREAIARSESEEAAKAALNLSWYYVASFLIALALGTYKIASWIVGRSLLLAAARHFNDAVAAVALGFEGILNFAAVPMLLYGLAGLLLWRVAWVQRTISALTAPLVGNLDWFVSEYMALRRNRVAQLLFVAGMATALSLMPQVAGDGFYNRILRGIRTSLGADVLLEFNMQELAHAPVGAKNLAGYEEAVQLPLQQLREKIAGVDGVASVGVIQQFLIPSIYIPGQSGLLVDLIDDPANYLKTVHYEERLGLTHPFAEEIRSLQDHGVLGSHGLFRVRAIPLQKPVILGYDARQEPILVNFSDTVAFLPGQPSLGIEQREGYADAEVDYLNYLLGADARMVLSRQSVAQLPALNELTVIPSRAVFLVATGDGVGKEGLIARLKEQLPWKPDQVRWEDDERKRAGKDMFVSLALENMRVYMVGSLLLACASVAAIALANFLADQRTFGLLRLRGLAPSMLIKIALSFFLLPVLAGVLMGIAVGTVSGYGLSQAIWDLPRVYGIGVFLANRLTFSLTSVAIVLSLSAIFVMVAWSLGLWLFRTTAREAIRE